MHDFTYILVYMENSVIETRKIKTYFPIHSNCNTRAYTCEEIKYTNMKPKGRLGKENYNYLVHI